MNKKAHIDILFVSVESGHGELGHGVSSLRGGTTETGRRGRR